jgi:hypothetical protein
MRRIALALIGTLALTMMSMQPRLLALGDVPVTLTCSDGIQMIETTLVVGPATLTALKSAVEAMILYPAGQVCRITEPPLLGPLVGALLAPGVAFAQDPPKDFVVGGGRFVSCVNFSISAHSDAVNSPGSAKGSITLDIPESCGEPRGGLKAKVVCLFVEDNVARIAATYQASHGSFTQDGHVEAVFIDNGNPEPDGPGAVDSVGIAINVSDPLPSAPPCNSSGIPDVVMSNGNVSVHNAP